MRTQTDSHDKVNSRFSQFCERAEKKGKCVYVQSIVPEQEIVNV